MHAGTIKKLLYGLHTSAALSEIIHELKPELVHYHPKPPIPLDGDSATIRNFGQNDTNRSRNGKSAVEAPWSYRIFRFYIERI